MQGKRKGTQRAVKISKIVSAVAAGKSVAAAGLAAGCSPRSAVVRASELLHSPDGQAALERALDKIEASAKSVSAIDEGLTKGRKMTKAEAVDRVLRIKRIIDGPDKGQTVNLFMQFAERIQKEGVVGLDGNIEPINVEGSHE